MNHLIKVTIVSISIILTACSSVGDTTGSKKSHMEPDMTDKTTLIVTSNPNPDQQEALKEYVQGVMPLLLNLGGVVIKRSTITDTYHGEKHFTFLLVMDFPSKKALKDMFESDNYKSLIQIREKGFKTIDIFFADNLE
jgi:uncharacterized protein (DUF1330 family)